MTIDIPEFDSNLEGYSCYVVEALCHAKWTVYNEDGEHQATECGMRLPDAPLHDPDVEIGPRVEFVENDVDMCPECWPDGLVDEAS